ncbi:hypothetical protein NQ317_008783 [Molorchus minor]|uniref:Endoglucanase n=1 Tax=Molorchus minor TaxID=1323400 RepID=A0ABQ9K1T9_9CUCU|nr:hypothetical protein NQ317_008783 [Molorchus minor]
MSKINTFFIFLFSLLLINVSCFHLPDFKPDYKEVLRLSLLFYESQSFTMAFTSTILAWGVKEYKDGYKEADQYKEVLEAIKWATDYFIKCHVSPNEFYGQVGDFPIDHMFWGRPEDMTMTRPAYKIDPNHPGSDLAGEGAAVFAATSLIFNDVNRTYAEELLRHSVELYNFAKTYRRFSCPDRPASCGWEQFRSPLPNPQILHGAVVSGPDQNDLYEDVREDFGYNEVTLYYNAGFQSAVAGLIQLQSDDL